MAKPLPQPAEPEFARSEEARGTEYHVTLPTFEGPLDLLLHLIQKHELDILDIPVGFVTSKYLEYIEMMRELSIDVASEYLVMAATLAHIKSKMLLPVVPADQEDEGSLEEEDPRAELIRRLLEYQKYKQAAADLSDRGALGRDVFPRGSPGPEATPGIAPLAEVGVFSLLDAFAKVLSKAKVDFQHEIALDRMSITDRIQELADTFRGRSSCRFEDLFADGRSRFDLVITFLALLEMTRLKMTKLYQADPLAEIHIELSGMNAESVVPEANDPEAPGEAEPVPAEAESTEHEEQP